MKRFLNPMNFRGYAAALVSRFQLQMMDLETIEREESQKFMKLGWDTSLALQRLTPVLVQRIGRTFDYRTDSIHWLLFAAIAAHEKTQSILEIGTHDGSFTAILAELFPDATITTVDLPEEDPLLRSTYNRDDDDAYRRFMRTQTGNLDHPRITSLKKNSFFLLDELCGPFDVIWVDGGHLYPEVAWDLCNAYHLCKHGGAILCDDVIPDSCGVRNVEVSPDSHAVLDYIQRRVPGEVVLFLKRRNAAAARSRTRKYVSYFIKR